MKSKLVLTTLGLCTMLTMVSFGSMQGQEKVFMTVEGTTWGHSSLRVLIVQPANQSWWRTLYLNASLHAIDEWNSAVLIYASNYSGFSYISDLEMIPTVSLSMKPAFDIYVSWIESSSGLSESELGQSRTMYQGHTVINNSVILSTRHLDDSYNFSEADMQNIALHELGHSLGLGHSNATEDIMYPILTLKQDAIAISTLDLYAISKVFGWMNGTEPIYPQNTLVGLPSNISYWLLPIPARDIPPPQPQSLLEVVARFIEQIFRKPEILAIIIGASFVLVLVAAISIGLRRGKRVLSSTPSI
jgi:predicted Zn-dependent protease